MYERKKYPRHPKGILTTFGAVGTHLRNPWVTAWWSAAFPGFGHLLTSNHFKGFILILWEFVVNTQAHLNMAILWSLNGKFAEAKAVLDYRWLLLGLTDKHIFAIPIQKTMRKIAVFDQIYKADGVSVLDGAALLGTICMLLGVIYGSELYWGPSWTR